MTYRQLSIVMLASCSILIMPLKASAVEPIITLLGLIMVEKGVQKSNKNQKPDVRTWKSVLTPSEKDLLKRLNEHPAIQACVISANQKNAIASYQLRKITEFGVEVQNELALGKPGPGMDSDGYRRPAKAYQWCDQQAQMLASKQTYTNSLEYYAVGLMRLVVGSQQVVQTAQSEF